MVAIDKEEQDAINELMAMSAEELDVVDYDLKKWCCQAKNCTNGTIVRDYGISPMFYHPGRKARWYNLNLGFWMCGKHNKFVKRLSKSFPINDVMDRIIDYTKMPVNKMTDVVSTKTNKIDWTKDILDK